MAFFDHIEGFPLYKIIQDLKVCSLILYSNSNDIVLQREMLT